MSNNNQVISFKTFKSVHWLAISIRAFYLLLILSLERFKAFFPYLEISEKSIDKANFYIFLFIILSYIITTIYIKRWAKNLNSSKNSLVNRYMFVLCGAWTIQECGCVGAFVISFLGGEVKTAILQVILCALVVYLIAPSKEIYDLLQKRDIDSTS